MYENLEPCTTLYFTAPADEWSEALPLGNGRLGAMVYGRTDTELLQLNENSVWYGGPQDRTPRDALKNLPRLRELIRSEQHAEAEKLVRRAFFTTPQSQRHYEPLGSISLEFGHGENDVRNYSRVLDLETAVSSVQYDHNGIHYSRTAFASEPDNVLVIQLQSSRKTEVTVRLTRMSEKEYETNEFVESIISRNDGTDGKIQMRATAGGGKGTTSVCCVAQVSCEDDGDIEAVGNCLVIDSRSLTIVISAQTTFRHDHYCEKAIADAKLAIRQKDLRERHVLNYRYHFSRLQLQLSTDIVTEKTQLPTNERLLYLDPLDPSLVVLYHNFGRYLLLSCSRPGLKSLPATLQGIWNPSFQPPWGSKYTININTQMNYWPANVCNLEECEKPLFEHLQRVAEQGKRTAKIMYGCRGWAAHHNTDIWADTDPQYVII
jgi:Glycosyl hydrolase family 65, N-terminal domain